MRWTATRLRCAGAAQACPLLVRFRDPADPATVEQVLPATLDRSLGPGVRLLGMTVEVTNAPVMHGLARYLPWLRAHRGSPMALTRDRGRTRSLDERPLAERLHDGDFTRGLTR